MGNVFFGDKYRIRKGLRYFAGWVGGRDFSQLVLSLKIVGGKVIENEVAISLAVTETKLAGDAHLLLGKICDKFAKKEENGKKNIVAALFQKRAEVNFSARRAGP